MGIYNYFKSTQIAIVTHSPKTGFFRALTCPAASVNEQPYPSASVTRFGSFGHFFAQRIEHYRTLRVSRFGSFGYVLGDKKIPLSTDTSTPRLNKRNS